jgi:hypothetical protein
MPKVFIRSSDLTRERPIVVASYNDDVDIPDNAHGEGMSVLILPSYLLAGPSTESLGMSSLAKGWRARAGEIPIKAEAQRRIEKGFPVLDQLTLVHEMIDAITKYGTDLSKWPADVRQRKMAYDEGCKYITDVKDKARTHSAGVMPRDPASDKIWPPRLTKKL